MSPGCWQILILCGTPTAQQHGSGSLFWDWKDVHCDFPELRKRKMLITPEKEVQIAQITVPCMWSALSWFQECGWMDAHTAAGKAPSHLALQAELCQFLNQARFPLGKTSGISNSNCVPREILAMVSRHSHQWDLDKNNESFVHLQILLSKFTHSK